MAKISTGWLQSFYRLDLNNLGQYAFCKIFAEDKELIQKKLGINTNKYIPFANKEGSFFCVAKKSIKHEEVYHKYLICYFKLIGDTYYIFHEAQDVFMAFFFKLPRGQYSNGNNNMYSKSTSRANSSKTWRDVNLFINRRYYSIPRVIDSLRAFGSNIIMEDKPYSLRYDASTASDKDFNSDQHLAYIRVKNNETGKYEFLHIYHYMLRVLTYGMTITENITYSYHETKNVHGFLAEKPYVLSTYQSVSNVILPHVFTKINRKQLVSFDLIPDKFQVFKTDTIGNVNISEVDLVKEMIVDKWRKDKYKSGVHLWPLLEVESFMIRKKLCYLIVMNQYSAILMDSREYFNFKENMWKII